MSEYTQQSFLGGMNLKADDTRLQPNEYRAAFNLRNRYDILDTILESQLDIAAPVGIKQECVTFGNYVILFVAGAAYYRYYTNTGWTHIAGFTMSATAPRYWTAAVPIATTNYQRLLSNDNINGSFVQKNLAAAFAGNLPGLLVQDNISQPQFIFIDNQNNVQVRTTQTYEQWSVDWIDYTQAKDQREYVPVGNSMAMVDDILYIVSQDGNLIYRSVSGRPLDFMVNVTNTGYAGGNAQTTAYSIGVSGISTLRGMSDGSVFAGAGNYNALISKNMSNVAPKVFGEFTFIRKFLFNATCLSDRCILDSLGDTRFIDLTGVRSFNAIEQIQNEGRNSVFTSKIQAALGSVIQDPRYAAAILYDNFELYAVQTIFGPAIAVYDSLNECWTSFDTTQTGGKRIKQFAKIELSVQRLYAVTEDDQLYTLYIGPGKAKATVRTAAMNSSAVNGEQTVRENNPKMEVKLMEFRAIINNITQDCTAEVLPFVNNRQSASGDVVKPIQYRQPTNPYTGDLDLPDVDTQLSNLLWSFPNTEQGWKIFFLLSWTDGSIVQFSCTSRDETPMNPLNSQINTQ